MSQENTSNKPLIRYVNRQQMSWRAVDVERLIGEDHTARAIWELVGRLDLLSFYRAIDSRAEEGGRPAFDPQLLISLWVYAYTQGIGSAREVARRCEFDPAFQWLTGLDQVNYHTLADFRVAKQKNWTNSSRRFWQRSAKRVSSIGTGDAGRHEDSCSGEPAKFSVGEHHPGTLRTCAAACGRDGRSAGRGGQSESEASARPGAAGTAGALGKGP